ncbi:MAG: sugar transferase [Verrucomicrobiota bacterium JB022]|nr:sugar transferase [Verrucomicrobiota bacterium JB022]
MRGRHRQVLANTSFAVDIVGGSALLATTYHALDAFGPALQRLLSRVTGYPFHIQTVDHLLREGWWFGLILCSLLLALRLNGFYRLDLFASRRRVAWIATRAVAIGVGLAVLLLYTIGYEGLNRSLLFLFAGSFWLYLLLKEFLFRHYVMDRFCRRHPLQALLVCAGDAVARRRQEFQARHLRTVRIAGVLPLGGVGEHDDLPVVNGFDELGPALRSGRYQLVFLHQSGHNAFEQQVLAVAEEQGVEVWYFTAFPLPQKAQAEMDEFGGRPVVVFSTNRQYEAQLALKRSLDVTVATLLLLAFAPVMLLAAMAVCFSSPGPVLYKQMRTGWRGRAFAIWKFRTMYVDAESRRGEMPNELRGPVYKSRRDARITPVGRWLRRFSIDELPQLWNVLQGHMSLVGPRPLPLAETSAMPLPRDHRRYSVLPGLTGLWQVSGRADLEDFAEWVRLDLEYIDGWSLALDFRILARTVPVVLSGRGAR